MTVDQSLIQLAELVQETDGIVRLHLVVDGMMIIGIPISEEDFIAQTDQSLQEDYESRDWSDILQKFQDWQKVWRRRLPELAQVRDQGVFLHLVDVRVYNGSSEVMTYPTFRVDVTRVSAWTFAPQSGSMVVFRRVFKSWFEYEDE
jgi:hypothetical protein